MSQMTEITMASVMANIIIKARDVKTAAVSEQF